MSDPLTIIAGLSTIGSIFQGESAARQQKKAAAQAQANADRTYAQAEQASNKANAKTPNIAALAAANAIAGKSSTSLSGASGVDPSSLSLGRTTLLGGGG